MLAVQPSVVGMTPLSPGCGLKSDCPSAAVVL